MKLTFEVVISDEQEATLRRAWKKACDAGQTEDESAKLWIERMFISKVSSPVFEAIESWSDIADRREAAIEAIRSGNLSALAAVEAVIK